MAKLELNDIQILSYNLVMLYDDPSLFGDDQKCNFLREIMVDNGGNIYVSNAHHLNESKMLWVFGSRSGVTKKRLCLTTHGAIVDIPALIALCASRYDSRL